ncbi:Lrp/AsnC family leucine-responsive transcriptional regulator [Roseibium hamelinense]|uniref:Lrp/AsnC family leucine-responsive transcriptional regulator n=1 Tax=Roseibium hamelinense TaxID=150831 RepID=A0A562SHQ9_9HYPH|nr:Lrp/AsnC ligand binding domain-containing protein [Roseibium hamelinense]MTI43953.1 winged helix-turn-helix transcriptional regulator [Roseibium hamelinense]TWI80752.1 Lrp/AsnC family leucine-responsive transcriptional regulator [Roseibium hamelinense]
MTADFTDLDRTDRKILRVLQTEGRITNTDLAEKVGLSGTATADRLKRLIRDGFIESFSATLVPHKVGRGLLVFVEIKLDRTSAEIFDAFKREVERAEDILECHMVAGGFDYLLKSRVLDMNAYRKFLADVVLTLPGVRETHTYAVMEEIKDTHVLPV